MIPFNTYYGPGGAGNPPNIPNYGMVPNNGIRSTNPSSYPNSGVDYPVTFDPRFGLDHIRPNLLLNQSIQVPPNSTAAAYPTNTSNNTRCQSNYPINMSNNNAVGQPSTPVASNQLNIPDKVLAQTLECPVCLDLPVPPIIQCKRGHLICGMCRDTVQTCGICEEDFTGTRNFAVEALVEKLTIECKNVSCKSVCTVEHLRDHMNKCDYRDIVCMYCKYAAHWRSMMPSIRWEGYIDHLKQVHGNHSQVTLVNGLSMIYSNVYWNGALRPSPLDMLRDDWESVLLMKHEGVQFLVHTNRFKHLVYCWISAMLPEELASKYLADFHIMKDKDRGLAEGGENHVKWTLQVTSVHKNLEEVKCTRSCAQFQVRNLIALSTKDHNLDWRLYFQINIYRPRS